MHTDCDSFQLSLSDHIDSGQPLTGEVRTHLESCAECQVFHQTWSAGSSMSQAARGSQSAQLDSDFTQSILSSIEAKHRAKEMTPRKVSRAPWFAAAAAAVLVAVGLSLLTEQPTPTTTEVATNDTEPVSAAAPAELGLNLEDLPTAALNQQLNRLTTQGSSRVTSASKQLTRFSQSLLYFSTNLSDFIPAELDNRGPQGAAQKPSLQAG